MGIKQMSTGRGDVFTVPLSKLRVGENCRIESGDLNALALDLKANGQLVPLTVRTEKLAGDEFVVITDGSRRFRAMEIANKKYGAKITEAVCITEARDIKTEEQRIVLQLAANNGKPLEPIEYGYAFKKLQAAGWSVARLNKEAAPGRSRQWIVDCLKLTEDPEAIQQAVKAGKIKAATAKKLRTADPQDKETALLKADLGQKVTGRDVDEAKEQRKAAKKPMESLKFDAGVFGDGLVSTFGFQKASDVPDYKGNCTIRIDQLDPLFIGVYVK